MKAEKISNFGLFMGGLAIAITLSSCSGGVVSEQNPAIKIDGSSTVYPITKAVADQYLKAKDADADLTVEFSGTGGGFKKFCAGETDVSNASRPISQAEMTAFIYVNSSAAQKNPALKDFVEMYLEQAPELVNQVGYVPLPEDGYELTKIHFQRGKVGTVFGGKSAFNLTIDELLRKQAIF